MLAILNGFFGVYFHFFWLTAEIELILINDDAHSLPYCNQGNLLRFECWQFWTVFWLYLNRKYTTFKVGFFLGWFNLQLRWYLLTAEIKFILINDEAYSLPYSNQSNLLRFDCCQFWTVFWLYLFFHIFIFSENFFQD